MSRSHRRPYAACTGHNSAKRDKVQAHRGLRSLERKVLREVEDWDSFLLPEREEASWNNTYSWGRDGKQWLQRVSGRDYGDPKRLERQLKWIEECKRK